MDEFLVTKLHVPPHGRVVKEDFGIVSGTSMMSRMDWMDAFASFKSWMGGRVKTYEKPARKAMADAYGELVEKAQNLDSNVNAVLALDVETMVIGDIIGIILTGSAVQLEEE